MDTNYVNKALKDTSNIKWKFEVVTLDIFFNELCGYYAYIVDELDGDVKKEALKRLQETLNFAIQRAELHFICSLKNEGKWPDPLIGLIFSMGKFAGDAIECKEQEAAQNMVTNCVSKIWSSTRNNFEHLDNITDDYFDYDLDYIYCDNN